jgi:hypothetical protein
MRVANAIVRTALAAEIPIPVTENNSEGAAECNIDAAILFFLAASAVLK